MSPGRTDALTLFPPLLIESKSRSNRCDRKSSVNSFLWWWCQATLPMGPHPSWRGLLGQGHSGKLCGKTPPVAVFLPAPQNRTALGCSVVWGDKQKMSRQTNSRWFDQRKSIVNKLPEVENLSCTFASLSVHLPPSEPRYWALSAASIASVCLIYMFRREWGWKSKYLPLHQSVGSGEAEECTEQFSEPQPLRDNYKEDQTHCRKTNCNKLAKELKTLVVHCSKTGINSWEQISPRLAEGWCNWLWVQSDSAGNSVPWHLRGWLRNESCPASHSTGTDGIWCMLKQQRSCSVASGWSQNKWANVDNHTVRVMAKERPMGPQAGRIRIGSRYRKYRIAGWKKWDSTWTGRIAGIRLCLVQLWLK